MDKDDYLKSILEESCCYNLDNFFYDKEWANISSLCNISSNERDEERNYDNYKSEGNEGNKKATKNEKNALKHLE